MVWSDWVLGSGVAGAVGGREKPWFILPCSSRETRAFFLPFFSLPFLACLAMRLLLFDTFCCY